MFQFSPFPSLHLWHFQVQLCHNHTSLLVKKHYVWSWSFHLSVTLCTVIPKQLGIITLNHFFLVCGHSTYPSFPIYVFLRCPSKLVQLRAYDGNPSAPSYCICLFFFSVHFAEWRHILFFNECQWLQLTFILPLQPQVIHEQQMIGWFPLFTQHASCFVLS